MKKIDMGKFILLIGKDATEIFDYYKVKEMHGLNRADAQAEEVDKTVGNGVYIYGFTNYDPRDKKFTAKEPYKPFLFSGAGSEDSKFFSGAPDHSRSVLDCISQYLSTDLLAYSESTYCPLCNSSCI